VEIGLAGVKKSYIYSNVTLTISMGLTRGKQGVKTVFSIVLTRCYMHSQHTTKMKL